MKAPFISLVRLLVYLVSPLAVFGQATDLFISEYVEGSGSNKAIEVFNGTGATVDLTVYEVYLYSNGATSPSNDVNLGSLQATLDDGATLVLKNSGLGAYTGESYNSGVANFNGDDVVALAKDGTVIDIIGVIGVRENIFANQTLQRLSAVFAPVDPFDANEWTSLASDTFDGLGAHTFEGSGDPDPEPSEYPSNVAAVANDDGTITLSWTDAAGAVPPARYLVLVSTTDAPLLPVDGVPASADRDLSDGAGQFIVEQGEGTLVIGRLSPQTEYTFTLIPFNNGGLEVDYKTDGVPAAATVTSATVLINDDFSDLSGWSIVTVGAEAEWSLVGGAARANAFGAAGPADDWLVSGPLDLSLSANFLLQFDARIGFDDTGFDPALSVLLSTDYDGAGNVGAATWLTLPAALPAPGTVEFVTVADVPLSSFDGMAYLAFRYQSSGTAGSSSEQWEIDNVQVTPSANPLVSLALEWSLETVAENAGINALEGTVTIPVALSEALTIGLGNSQPAVLSLPPSVVISAGSTEAVFSVDVNAGLALPTPTTVSVVASAPGFLSTAASVTVQPLAARFLTLEISVAGVDEDAGPTAVTGTVTLSREAASYPLVVSLESSATDEATVPATITFASAAGGLTQNFAVDVLADGVFDLDTSVQFQATAPGYAASEDSLIVRNVDPQPALTLSVEPSSVFENAGAEASNLTVTLGADPLGGYPFEVTLSSDSPGEATVPATVTFDGSEGRVQVVSISAIPDDAVDGTQVATFSAAAAGFEDGVAMLEVLDVDGSATTRVLALLIQPDTLMEGEGATGTIKLSSVSERDLFVTLTSGDPTELTVPAVVAVPAGALTQQFSVNAVNDGLVDTDATVTILATAPEWGAGERIVRVLNRDVPSLLSLELTPGVVDEGQTVALEVSANNIPEGGIRVSLSSSDTTELETPNFIELTPALNSVVVSVPALNDGAVDEDVLVTLTATADGYPLARATVNVRNVDVPRATTIAFREDAVREGEMVLVDLSLNVPVETDTVVSLDSLPDLVFPASITIPAGGSVATIAGTAVAEDGFESDELVEWIVQVPGYLASADSIRVVDLDQRGRILTPLDGARFPFGESLRLRAEVADPLGTLEAVAFYVDGLEVSRLETAPFVVQYDPDPRLGDDEVNRSLLIQVEVFDSTLGTEILAPVTLDLTFSPVLNDSDFVYQFLRDLTGTEPDPSVQEFFESELNLGMSRASVIGSMVDEPSLSGALWATETMLLVYDRFPTFDELYTDSLFSVNIVGGNLIVLPPMALAATTEAGVFYSEDLLYPGGVRGVAHVLLHEKAEARERFGGEVSELDTPGLFTALWQGRHGAVPTAQQQLQANTRIEQFAQSLSTVAERGNMDTAQFARARFVESLVFEETFAFETDVIFNPPNRNLWDDARAGLVRTVLWGEAVLDRASLSDAADDFATYIESLLFHPRYWSRNGHNWLGAVPSIEVDDWYESAWLGHFSYTANAWPWVFHLEHGWLWVATPDPQAEDLWWYDLELGWTYTTGSAYPWIYLAEEQTWAFYAVGTSAPRWFWKASSGEWVTVP